MSAAIPTPVQPHLPMLIPLHLAQFTSAFRIELQVACAVFEWFSSRINHEKVADHEAPLTVSTACSICYRCSLGCQKIYIVLSRLRPSIPWSSPAMGACTACHPSRPGSRNQRASQRIHATVLSVFVFLPHNERREDHRRNARGEMTLSVCKLRKARSTEIIYICRYQIGATSRQCLKSETT
jgi:hypothetical protein